MLSFDAGLVVAFVVTAVFAATVASVKMNLRIESSK